MPNQGKVCVLAKSRREATAWMKQQDGLRPNRVLLAPLTRDRVKSIVYSKIVVLPSFEHVRTRHAIIKTLKQSENRRFIKNKPEWVELTDAEWTWPPPPHEPTFETPDGEIPGQTTIEEQIAMHEATQTSGADEAGTEGTLSGTDSQASPALEGTLSEDVGNDPAADEVGAVPESTPEEDDMAEPSSEAGADDAPEDTGSEGITTDSAPAPAPKPKAKPKRPAAKPHPAQADLDALLDG